jgi:Flp pilus assembly protein TadB
LCLKLLSLERKKKILLDEKELLEFDWKYKKRELTANLVCSALFVPVMAMIMATVLPSLVKGVALTLGALSMVTVVGGVLAVLITVGLTIYNKEQAIYKLKAEKGKVLRELSLLDKTKPNAALESQRLEKKADYLNHMIQYERKSQIFSVTMQLVFPLVVFSALLLPPPIAVGVILAFLLVALGLKLALMKSKPAAIEQSVKTLSQEEEKVEKLEKDEAIRVAPKLRFFPPVEGVDNKPALPGDLPFIEAVNPYDLCA